MHEFSIITSIVELIKAEMQKAGAVKVNEINLEVGELMFLSHEALDFGFRALAESEPGIGQDALRIIPVPAEVRCTKCGYTGPMKVAEPEEYHRMPAPIFKCPKCSGPVEVIKGRECTVRNIRMEVPDV